MTLRFRIREYSASRVFFSSLRPIFQCRSKLLAPEVPGAGSRRSGVVEGEKEGKETELDTYMVSALLPIWILPL